MAKAPLADELRPNKLKDFVGQDDIVGKEGIITKLIDGAKETGFFPSLVFWGPPGSGKTTLARIISNELEREFYEFSAVNTSAKDVENIVQNTKQQNVPKNQQALIKESESKKHAPIVFIDEIHRFNKAQQDKLLPYVEDGRIILIGATTENPSFEVIGPLLSRTRVLVLKQIDETGLQEIIERALKKIKLDITDDALNFLIEASNGDARVVLNVLEIAANLTSGADLGKTKKGRKKKIKLDTVEQAMQRRQFTFDKKGEEYYNVISAFIKSMRASNVNAALYYLARMVEAGQDPLYIARRMVVFASEDVGLAQPTALVVANEVFKACEVVGYPECAINLAHGTAYLARAKKDRSAYDAYFKAVEDVKRYGNLPVPNNLRNPVTKLMKDVGYGEDYEPYTDEDLLPEKLKGKKYYKKN
jgi:putative ATPase